MTRSARRGAGWALLAAGLYGAAAPFEKRLLAAGAGPIEVAGLLYVGAAAGLTALLAARRLLTPAGAPQRPPLLGDARVVVALVVATLFGGLVGPVLKLAGLARSSGMAASLLLNLEVPATVLLAVAFFGERIGARIVVGSLLVVAGSVLLGLHPGGGPGAASWLGVLAIAGSSAAWALDNNVTARVAARDALAIARFKCAAAAPLTLALAAAATGRPFWRSPLGASEILAALAIGLLSYGVSLACFVRALRELGAARTGTLFASAPFLGAMVTIPVLDERPSWTIAAAGALMAAGALAIVREGAGPALGERSPP